MRSKTLFRWACLAPLVLSAPIPFVLVDDLGPPVLGAHPPAPVVIRPGQTLPDMLGDDADSLDQQPIDNRPITPSSTVAPSVALASPKPVATTYLLSLAMSRPRPTPAVEDGDDAGAGDSSSLSATKQTKDGSPRGGRRAGMPCYYAHARRRGSDMIAIGLVAVFVFVVVLVEIWTAVCDRMRQLTRRHGSIRLGRDETRGEKTLLSIQAPPPAPAADNEAQGKQGI